MEKNEISQEIMAELITMESNLRQLAIALEIVKARIEWGAMAEASDLVLPLTLEWIISKVKKVVTTRDA